MVAVTPSSSPMTGIEDFRDQLNEIIKFSKTLHTADVRHPAHAVANVRATGTPPLR